MATTTNFGWETPDDTDLVKDGAAAIRTALGGVDTSFVDLKGGTTGQVLSKASNTDLDYTWVTTDDTNAIQNAIVDAKGDLIAATAADTPARLAVGSNGQILTADSSAATGLAWATPSSGGGLTLLQSLSLSGASVTSSTFSATSYKNYFVVLSDIYLVNPNSDFDLRLNADSGSNYNRSGVLCAAGSLSGGVTSNGSSFRLGTLGALSGAGQRGYGTIQINRINDTSEVYISSQLYSTLSAGSDIRFMQSGGIYNNSAAITSLTFLAPTNDFAAGTAYIYGVN
jgi:hypothetical protein